MAGDIDRGAVAEEGEGDPRRITGHARLYIHLIGHNLCAGVRGERTPRRSQTYVTDWFPHLPQSGKAAAHAKLEKAPPLGGKHLCISRLLH